MEYYRTFNLVDTFDRIALLVSLWITAAHEHDADCCTLIKLDVSLVKVASSNTLEEVYDVALQSEHDTFCLWVAHTAVVLDDHWLALNVDQSEEDEALVVDVLFCKSLYCRTDDALVYLLHPFLGSKRYWGNATHTTSIQAGIMLTDTLVVLSLRQNLIVLAVSENKYRAFDAAQEFLDNYACRSIAEHTAQHLLELLLCLFQSREDENTLTCAQTVSLQYVWSLQGFQEFKTFLYMFAIESLVLSCRNVVALHKLLGEVLAAFQYSTCL